MYGKINTILGASQVVLVVKNPPANAGDTTDTGSIPGSERSSGVGHSNQLQYSCLENSIYRGTWQATVHGGHEELDINTRIHFYILGHSYNENTH